MRITPGTARATFLVGLIAAAPRLVSSQTCNTSATCATVPGASPCGSSASAPSGSSLCGVSGASCGTLVAFDVDPALNAAPPATKTSADRLGLESLDDLIEPVRASYRVPALVISVARSDGVFAAGAVGVRVAGAEPRVTVTDRFHLGSCGKAITATVAARMVERGQITWETTIGDLFRDYPASRETAYRDVTLRQLLAHRSGMPPRDDGVMTRVRALDEDTKPQRGAFVRMAFDLPPAAEPGTTFLYTDVGYTVAGAMLERAAGKAWEELVLEHVAAPLGLTSVGFGEPATPGTMDQPWGHVADGTRTIPFAPGPYASIDNPAVLGPAGLVHLSIVDWGRFAVDHLQGERSGGGVLLSADGYRSLYTGVDGQNYGLGWGLSKGELGRTLTHTGSCGEWYSMIEIIPDSDLAIVVATNISGGNGVAACSEALRTVVSRLVVDANGAAARAGN